MALWVPIKVTLRGIRKEMRHNKHTRISDRYVMMIYKPDIEARTPKHLGVLLQARSSKSCSVGAGKARK